METLFDLFMIAVFMTGLVGLFLVGSGIMWLLDKLCPKFCDKLIDIMSR
jgi:hypothetical protein